MMDKWLEPDLYSEAPAVCIKPGCGGTAIVPHEDGWQCFSCMKIIYKAYDRMAKKVLVKRYAHDKDLGD